jgi:hypothetical protein
MTKFYAFVVIMALRVFYQPGNNPSQIAAFSNPSPAKLVSLKAAVQKQKVFLKWSVSENETADQFTIEKSIDGKNFQVAALAFGSDKPGTILYEFYEKAGNQKTSYRIKLINKDRKEEYSEVVTVNPSLFKS